VRTRGGVRRSASNTNWPLAVLAALAAARCSGAPAVDKQKLERLYRAAMAVETATQAGPTFEQFSGAVQGLATELAIARDQVSAPEERQLLDRYAKALRIFRDSVTLWSAERKAAEGDAVIAARASSLDAPAPAATTEIEPLVQRYELPTRVAAEDREKLLAFMRRAAAKDRRLESLWLKAVFMTEDELRAAFARAGVAVHAGESTFLPAGSHRTLWPLAARALAEGHRLYRGP